MGRRDECVGQLALFRPKDPPPKRRTVTNGNRDPKWSKYKAVNPHRCDFCALNQAEDPFAPVARKARYRRESKDGDLYLCVPHANDQRIVDGLRSVKT